MQLLSHVWMLAQMDPDISAARDRWADTFWGLDQVQRFVVILTVLGCVTCAVISIASFVYAAFNSAHRRRMEADLKREMLDRGMSAEEVVKVIEASAPPEDATSRWIDSWCKSRKK